MLSYELAEVVLRYIYEEISLSDLEDWYVPRLPYFLNSPEAGDSEVIGVIELGLAEDITEEEFRQNLREALSEQNGILYQQSPPALYTSSSNSFQAIGPEPYEVTISTQGVKLQE